ncbi:MAG: ISKra4 family transposase, partial [Candidatus Dormibacteraceae bacterium]
CRAYYHCATCGKGVCPRDRDLGVEGSSLSPGLLRMVARTGSDEPFGEARRDLQELAGLELTAKRVERTTEAVGESVRLGAEAEADGILSGQILPALGVEAPTKLYITLDGTGVPMVPRENAGRRGKGVDGRAHTREVKLGCLFTQTKLDQEGNPVRDPDSSTYAFSLANAERFGTLLYAEARTRGVDLAKEVIVIGDGAPWIWNLADEHFPGAIQIVDLYHARQHLHDLAKQVLPGGGVEDGGAWLADRLAELDQGDIDQLLLALLETPAAANEEVRKAISYFDTNRQRMRYGRFRHDGLFVGSGAVEAGCKKVVHKRLKQSGMRWTVRGAGSVISLRCQHASDRWDEIWKWAHAQTSVA